MKRRSKYQKKKEEAIREVREKNKGKVKVYINHRTFVLCDPNEVDMVKEKYRLKGRQGEHIQSVRNSNPLSV